MVISVIIVSYNTRELLRGCLTALLESLGVSLAISVVDNASRDGSAEMVRAEFPVVQLLAQSQNLGFAAANNVALRALGFGTVETASLPEFVLLLNPDTVVRPLAVATLCRFLQQHATAGAVGPQLIYADGRFQHSAFRFPGLFQTFYDFFPLHHRLADSRWNGRYSHHELPFAIDHPLGACILARREAIDQAGFMDEGYFMYVEEVDWCRRMKQTGWSIWCEPRAVIVHYEGQATRQFRQAMFVQLWRSRLRYFRRYHSPLYSRLIELIVRLGLWHATRQLMRTATPVAERTQRLAAFAAVRALCRRPAER